MHPLDPPTYWHETERRMAVENYRDRMAARAVNAAWELVNAEPFGTPRAEQ